MTTEHAMYRGAVQGQISALTLHVRARKVKWKLAQNRSREQREKLIAELRKRGRPTDAGAADALQWTLDHEAAEVAAPFPFGRVVAVWMLIMLAETAHGAVREVFIAPVLGGLRARQLGVLIGSAHHLRDRLGDRALDGCTHAADTTPRGRDLGRARPLLFEFSLGLALELELGAHSLGLQSRRAADSWLPGLAFMFFAPRLAAKMRRI